MDLTGVHAVYQPVVELADRQVIGYEALARGPVGGALHSPVALFAAARSAGELAQLDWTCRLLALRGALDAGLPQRLALFVNVEPQAMASAGPPGAEEVLQASSGLQVVMEITERALTEDPAGLLRAAEAARRRGWQVALDDVGADRASLALLPFLRPDVIKLDLRLVQTHTTVDTAEIITAVNAEAERTGAVVLAEGIETEDQAQLALMMGARLGQGWLFGRPDRLPDERSGQSWPSGAPVLAVNPVEPGGPSADRSSPLGRPQSRPVLPAADSPFGLVRDRAGLRRSTKPLLRAISRQLERQALALGDAAVVLGTFQQRRHFTSGTARRYATLATGSPFVAAFAVDLPPEPAEAVRGVALADDDVLADEWDVVVVGPHFTGALLAHDVGDTGPEDERRFDFQVTYDRPTVLAAAMMLMHQVPSRAVPDETAATDGAPLAPSPSAGQVEPRRHAGAIAVDRRSGVTTRRRWRAARARRGPARPGHLDTVLTAAVRDAPYGVSVVDARHPDLPLVWVNEAFSRLTGRDRADLLDRNCRFLQGPDTDPEVAHDIGVRLRAGRPVRTTLLNYRLDGSTFWNDLQITAVNDPDGQLTHYVGQQNDVTDRTQALQRADHLARHDGLTGLANRAHLHSHIAEQTARADRAATSVALLFLDVDDFKLVNDTLGHTAGDQLLEVLAARLRSTSRSGDLLARVGGDEFVLVVSGLREGAEAVARHRAVQILAALEQPLALPGHPQPVRIRASIGISLFPGDASGPDQLLDHADQAMYAAKNDSRHYQLYVQHEAGDALRAAGPHPQHSAPPLGNVPLTVGDVQRFS